MLWSLFAREFSQQARAIARTVSNAPVPLGGGPSAPADSRRPSMRLAVEDVSKATSDTSKQAKMGALKTKMKAIFAIDVFLLLVVVTAVFKMLFTGRSNFSAITGTEHGPVTRLVLFNVGMGLGVTLEMLALYIHYKEPRGTELTDAQKAVSERVFDDIVRRTGTHTSHRNPTTLH
jgi:hypothetical protein